MGQFSVKTEKKIKEYDLFKLLLLLFFFKENNRRKYLNRIRLDLEVRMKETIPISSKLKSH
jgi:hypothetical protein